MTRHEKFLHLRYHALRLLWSAATASVCIQTVCGLTAGLTAGLTVVGPVSELLTALTLGLFNRHSFSHSEVVRAARTTKMI